MENNQELITQCEARAKQWLTPAFDEDTRKEVQAMLDSEDKSALIDAFYQNLEFGTGGLRGTMGVGTNRMNKYIVGMATQGFANYILKAFPGEENLSVVVGHDCRNNSRLFAETVAAIFSANGIKAYLFESLRPTPEISFAIRELGAKAGVNVTASHNPKEYNGYKAYWSDGAQVLAPHDTGIIDEVNKVGIDDVKFEANWDNIKIIGGEMDYDYMEAVHSAMIDQDVINRQKDLNIVYTPMHGTGRVIVPLCLRSWGFQNIKADRLPLMITHSPLSSRHTIARRSASGSVATTRSALSFVPSFIPRVIASAFSGLGETTVGKVPSITICSGTTLMFWNPQERKQSGTITRPVPCIGV